MLATMLSFCYEGHQPANRLDLFLAYVPPVVLDWAIVALVVGLLLWYGDKNNLWRTALMGSQIGALLGFTCVVAV